MYIPAAKSDPSCSILSISFLYAPSATISSESTNAKYLPLAFAIPICEEIAPPEFGFTIRLNCGLSLIYSFITYTELSVLESSIINTS